MKVPTATAETAPTLASKAGSGGGLWPEKPKAELASNPELELEKDKVSISPEAAALAGSGGGLWPDIK